MNATTNTTKQMHQIHYKGIAFKMEDYDDKERVVKGYLSAFGSKDADNDVIMPGAFTKSITERGPNGSNRIKYLRYHDPEHQIGKFLELSQDSFGLKFVGQLSGSTKGLDAYEDYKCGVITEHSIGFNYVGDKIRYDQESDTFYVSELKLFEGSPVTWASNENTPMIEVRSMNADAIELHAKRLRRQFEALTKAIRSHKGTDDHIEDLELRSRMIATQYDELVSHLATVSKQPSLKDTVKGMQPVENRGIFSRLIPKP